MGYDADTPSETAGAEDPDLTPSERRRGLTAVIACISIFGTTGGLNATLISMAMHERGASETAIGLNGSAFALGIFIFAPILPRLGRRLDARALILALLAMDVVAILALPLNESPVLWFLARTVMGMAAAGIYGLSETWINQIAEDRNRGRVMGIYVTCLSLGFAMGPTVVAFTGVTGWIPFLTAAGILGIGAVPVFLTGRARVNTRSGARFGVLRFFVLAPTIALAVFVVAFKDMTASALLPVFARSYGLDTAAAALTVTAAAMGAVVLQIPIGWLGERMGNRMGRAPLLAFCALLSAVAALLLPLVITDPVWSWPVLLVWSGLVSGMYTVALALLGERFRGTELVTANAAIGLLWGFGSLLGPSVAGGVMAAAGPDGFPYVMAAAAFLFCLFALFRHLRGANVGPRSGPPGTPRTGSRER